MNGNEKYRRINFGPQPENDGWHFIYSFYKKIIKPFPLLRTIARGYFLPFKFELVKNREIYKSLGINKLGRYIPTGGIAIRKITKAKMKAYTLSSTNLNSAREFFFRTVVFEFLHLPFFIAMMAMIIHRISIGEYRFAFENLLLNLIFNLIPMLHHRNTRARIVSLLIKK